MVAASRKVYVQQNGSFTKSMLPKFFRFDSDGQPLRFGDSYLLGRNEQRISNSLRYAFMGDPALKVPNHPYKVNIAVINGTEIGSGMSPDSQLPEVQAMSAVTVTGEVLRPDGTVADDFNGTVTLQLYDGERVVTTFGQGASGVVRSYNDRDKRLAMTTAKVTDGHWNALLRVPPEIQGLYTTAMIAGYAWSDDRKEANGVTTNLYVYGYDESTGGDDKGPEIEYFYINTPNFENGGVVNSNPVVIARISDESGINISDTGIGHSMTLTIDDKEIYSDLSSYFSPDTDADSAGNAGLIVYPLTGLKGGMHTLELSVWDNANNVSKATLEMNVGAAIDPVIYDITASTNPTSVDFRIATDRPNTALYCSIGIYDLSGRRIWSLDDTLNSDLQSNVKTSWNLCNSAGTRVPRGIYVYRVTVETPEGTYSSKSKKIAVSGPAD